MAMDKKGRKLPRGIRQRGDTFEGRFMYQGNSYTVHGATIAATQKAITETKYKLEHGLFVQKTKITFGSWFDTWMQEYKKNRVKAGTFETYQRIYDAMLKSEFELQEIANIRPEHIQRLYNKFVKKEYAISTIEIASIVLSGCLEQAVKNHLIERNPAKMAELPRRKGKQMKKRMALTRKQQALFMEYAKDSYLYNLFAVMLRTGLRVGEALALKPVDIDRRKNVLHVQRTLKHISGRGFIEDTPKTQTSARDIPLTADVLALLDAQRKFWGFKVEKIDRYLFFNENGEPLSRDRVQGEINRIIKRITADGNEFPYITSHVFRHCFATRAIENGMTPQVLKTILGHSSLAMTMDLYSHVLPDTKAAEMEKIADAF
ncbi:MAG: site-specific integrase [Clostridiales bacterium]|nr:site-specific integrase [Clostridiales bacterium]